MRSYKTDSGTYSESELAVVVWMNPRKNTARQARYLETMTAENSPLPMVFPIKALRADRAWEKAKIALDGVDLTNKIMKSSRMEPIIVPIPLAKSYLGWDDFYVPSEYVGA
jgi:hypothetical protein